MVNVVLTFHNTRQLNDDSHWVAHTHEVIAGLDSVLALANDAETGQRGFLLTGEPRYLAPYEAAVPALWNQVDRLARLTADNPRQQARIPALRSHLAAKLRELAETIALRRQPDGFDAARRAMLTGQGKVEMDALRRVVGEMIGNEQTLLRERSRRSERTYRVAVIAGCLSGLAALAALAAFLVLLRRHLASRDRAAAVIAEQAERLRTTLASIGDAVITTDLEGRLTNLNAVAESLTGWSRGEALGQPLETVFRIVNEESRQPVASPVTRALAEGVVVGLANHTILLARDGTEWPIDDSAAPIRCKDGEIVGCVLVFRDVSEGKRAEAAVRQAAERERLLLAEAATANAKLAADLSDADRRKDEFLATLAHELRNPLAPIRNSLQILKLAAPGGAIVEQARSIMERQLGQMVRLVDDLLDVSRITRNSLELRRERVELAAVLASAVETSRPLIEANGHELTVSLPPQPVHLDADLTRLAQVFSNLLNNAARYTEKGGRIRLAAERQGDEAVVTVADTGVGIPLAMLPKIFDMFTQVDRTLERTQGGLGIGLTLVRQLVHMHGGTVQAFSEGPGKGSELVVRLPVVPTTEGSAPAPPSPR